MSVIPSASGERPCGSVFDLFVQYQHGAAEGGSSFSGDGSSFGNTVATAAMALTSCRLVAGRDAGMRETRAGQESDVGGAGRGALRSLAAKPRGGGSPSAFPPQSAAAVRSVRPRVSRRRGGSAPCSSAVQRPSDDDDAPGAPTPVGRRAEAGAPAAGLRRRRCGGATIERTSLAMAGREPGGRAVRRCGGAQPLVALAD